MIYCFEGVTDSNIQLVPTAIFTIDDPRTREILHVLKILPPYSSTHYIDVVISLKLLDFQKKLVNDNDTQNKDYDS